MPNMILSLYRLFFVDENEKIWAVLKDGRLCFLKNGASFSGFSSDKKGILGVSFKQNTTSVLALDLRFSQMPPYLLYQAQGYIYYPALFIQKKLRLAFLEADLLSEQGCGNLVIMEKARTKFKKLFQTPARISPPIFHETTGDLFFINATGTFCQLNKKTFSITCLEENITCFAIHEKSGSKAVLKNGTITVRDHTEKTIHSITATDVTSFCFSASGDELFLVTDKGNRSDLYSYHPKQDTMTLILSHVDKIVGLSC